METVVAIGIVAILLTGFLTVFGPASAAIQRSLQGAEAKSLSKAIQDEISILKESDNGISSGFEKAFLQVLKGQQLGGGTDGGLLAYNYRASLPLDIDATTGSPRPYIGEGGNVNEDYVVVAAARPIEEEAIIRQELTNSLEGRVYFVRLLPMAITASDGTRLDRRINPSTGFSIDGQTFTTADTYPGGGIPITAELFELPTVDPGFVLGSGGGAAYQGPDEDVRPILSTSFVVRR